MENIKKPNAIRDKSFVFALRIVRLYKFLKEQNEYVMSKQLLRSGTSIGALVREAEHAESKADFIHKMAIAQKEANEAEYWIELLYHAEYLDEAQYMSISQDASDLIKILAAIIITSRKRKSN